MRDPEIMAHVQPLTDAGILVMAVVPVSATEWFISASYPASAGLFGGIYHAELAPSLEEAVERQLAWYEELWGGL
jgi:hypothetical protein